MHQLIAHVNITILPLICFKLKQLGDSSRSFHLGPIHLLLHLRWSASRYLVSFSDHNLAEADRAVSNDLSRKTQFAVVSAVVTLQNHHEFDPIPRAHPEQEPKPDASGREGGDSTRCIHTIPWMRSTRKARLQLTTVTCLRNFMSPKRGAASITTTGVRGSHPARCDENVMPGGPAVECLSSEDDVMGYPRGDGKMMPIN